MRPATSDASSNASFPILNVYSDPPSFHRENEYPGQTDERSFQRQQEGRTMVKLPPRQPLMTSASLDQTRVPTVTEARVQRPALKAQRPLSVASRSQKRNRTAMRNARIRVHTALRVLGSQIINYEHQANEFPVRFRK